MDTGQHAVDVDLPIDDLDTVLDVNLRGVILGMRYGIPAMIKSGGGAIVNWSSVGGLNATPKSGPYAVSKAGVIAATDSVRPVPADDASTSPAAVDSSRSRSMSAVLNSATAEMLPGPPRAKLK